MYLLGRSLDFLLFTVFDFALLNHITASEEICGKVNGKVRCYFKVWELQGNWDSAWQLCNSRNSTLPVIRNWNDQKFLEKFLFEHVFGSTFWTSGRGYVYDDYTWVDGRQFFVDGDGDMWSPRGFLLHPFYDYDMGKRLQYVCQYSGDLCINFNDTINITNGCIRESDDRRSWYEARNQCLMTGGDLATFLNADLENSELLLYRRFRIHWLGLRSKSWRWNLNRNATEEDDIKYTNWLDSRNVFFRDCISINASNGAWSTTNCSVKLNVVCQRDIVNTSSESASFISVVVVSVCVIIISNIVVATVVRRRCSNVAPNSDIDLAENMRYQDLETTQRQAIPEATYTDIQLQPVYEEVCQRGK